MSNKLIFIIWLFSAIIFAAIVYAAIKLNLVFSLLAVIVAVFAAAMYMIRNNKLK